MRPIADVRAVLFDLDGTLVDSAPDLAAAADQMRLRRGMPSLPFHHYRAFAGAGARGLLGVAFGVTPEQPGFDALRDEFFANYDQCLTQRTVAFDGVAELIGQLLQRGLRWGVVTNKSARFAEPLVRAMPLFASCATLVCGDTTPHAKPHPAPLLEAARQLDCAPQNCLYVGDDARDIVAGRAASMHTVAACYGYLHAPHAAQEWGAHAQINSPLDLLLCLPKA